MRIMGSPSWYRSPLTSCDGRQADQASGQAFLSAPDSRARPRVGRPDAAPPAEHPNLTSGGTVGTSVEATAVDPLVLFIAASPRLWWF